MKRQIDFRFEIDFIVVKKIYKVDKKELYLFNTITCCFIFHLFIEFSHYVSETFFLLTNPVDKKTR